jgi:DNA repair exonuclease SbcCD nuclease subunit
LTVVRIGDPHLGRRFINGVPLHRRGEREQQVRQEFIRRLNDLPEDAWLVGVMGDLFESFVVPPEVELFAADEVRAAAEKHPDVVYVFLRGNHDASRNLGLKSSFDVFCDLVKGCHNVITVRSPLVWEHCGFVPWDPFATAEEQVAALGDGPFDEVFGHWDLESFGGDTHNLMPREALKKITTRVSTGHIHKRHMIQDGALSIEVVGSMLPYAHGEDADDEASPTYVTLNLDELSKLDMASLKDKCVRVLLRPGESIPDDLDARQILKRPYTDITEQEVAKVEIEAFDFKALFIEEMNKQNVSGHVQTKIWDSYETKRGV